MPTRHFYRRVADYLCRHQRALPVLVFLGIWLFSTALAQDHELPSGGQWQSFSEIELAAHAGDAAAQFLMGQLHESGREVERDLVTALRWYRRSADQGYALAQFSIGAMYDFGEGVEQNFGQALEWYGRAAEQGLALAQHNLGNLYADGMGVAADPKRAVTWFRRAAEQGFVEAQYNLGYMYASGEGVTIDFDEAFFWWTMAADQGDATAQRNLERLVERADPEDLNRMQSNTLARRADLARAQEAGATFIATGDEDRRPRDLAAVATVSEIETITSTETISDTRPQIGTTNRGPTDYASMGPVEPAPSMARNASSDESATPVSVAADASDLDSQVILDTVDQWARAWSAQDVEAYLAAYAPDFKPEGSQTHSAWVRQRTERLQSPQFIRVEISNPRVVQINADLTQVTFRQRYESNRLSSERLKALDLRPINGAWLIVREQLLD